MTTVEVGFACNDRHGSFTGHAEAVEFGVPGATLTDVSVDSFDLEDGWPLEFRDSVDVVFVAGESFAIENYSRQRYQGNIIWDSVKMDLEEAKRLLRHLFENDAQLDEWTDGTELGDLVEGLTR